MPPRYVLRCLGSPELRGPTGEPIRIRTRKHLALLIYLAVEPRQHHRRDRLADLLWPNASLAEARHSLATALSMIRGKLGPRSYESSRDTVKLITPELELDLDRLLRGEVLGDDFTPPLDMGGFLDDFEVPTAAEFMHWRDQRRAQLFPTIRSGFVTLMDRRRRTGAFALIEPLADRLLELDPLSEEAIRAKMEGRAFAGDRISALRIYQDWRERLHAELGATPSELVEGMALRLRQRGYEDPGTSHVPTVQTDQWRNRAFVGREAEYRALYERWEQAKVGRGSHALLLGDSGVGKTTLLERLVTAAGLEGAVSARVQCYEAESEIPYASINTLIRGMIDRPGASATQPEWLAELANTIPAVAARFPALPKPPVYERETARLRVAEAVLQLAAAIADEHPFILVIDDLHLADDVSVAVLHQLMRRTRDLRVMFVLAAQKTGLLTRPNASRLLENHLDMGLATIDIPLLTKAELEVVLDSLSLGANRQPSLAIAHALVIASAGNPMVVELLFDDWIHHGDLCLALSVNAMTEHLQGNTGADALFKQIIGRVSPGLSEPARAVLNLAAILGDRLNELSMYELVDLTLAQTLSGMAELTSRRIFRDGGRELEFRNELLRGQAYLNVPSPLRRALHGLIVERLVKARQRGENVPGLALAWHCYRAGRGAEADPYLLSGSIEAIDRGAPFEAELAIASALPQLDGTTRLRARLVLATALQEQGRWNESLDAVSDDTHWPEELGQRRTAIELNARAVLTQDTALSSDLLNRVADLMGTECDVSILLLYATTAIRLAYYLGDVSASSRIVECLADIDAQPLTPQDRAALAYSLAAMAWSSRQLSRFPFLREALKRSSLELQAIGVSSSLQYGLENVRGCFEAALGDYEEAVMAFTTAVHCTEGLGDDEKWGNAAANLALCYGRLGRFYEQQKASEQALNASRPAHWRQYQAKYCFAWSQAMLGEHRKALAVLADGLLPPGTPTWLTQTGGLLTADIYQLCGYGREAITEASNTLQLFGVEMLSGSYPGTLARWIARCLLEGTAPRGAEEALTRLFEDAGSLDLIDQAQVFASVLLIPGTRTSLPAGECEKVKKRLANVLELLPEITSTQLRRLGVSCEAQTRE